MTDVVGHIRVSEEDPIDGLEVVAFADGGAKLTAFSGTVGPGKYELRRVDE